MEMKTISQGLLRSALAGVLSFGCGLSIHAANAQALQQTRIVHIADGDVQGTTADGVDKFLGIRYAAAPIGDLRWKPPQPPARWTGTLQATKFGATCVQPQRGVFASPSKSEACLDINVFAPHA